jgi:hypothetical protein
LDQFEQVEGFNLYLLKLILDTSWIRFPDYVSMFLAGEVGYKPVITMQGDPHSKQISLYGIVLQLTFERIQQPDHDQTPQ